MKTNWLVKKLGEVVTINPPKSEVSNLAMGTAVSFVSMASINENIGTISNMQTKKLEDVKNGYTYFANNDVLFAKITPCMENGKVAIAQNLQNGIGFGTTEVHVLRPTNQVLPEWIYSNVSRDQFRAEAEKYMTGSAGQQRVPKEFLENAQILVPPINSQKKIVERLDTIRKAQELCDLQISKTEEFFESILTRNFRQDTGGWKVENLGEVADVTSSKRVFKSDYVQEGIPFYRTKEIVEFNQGKPISLDLYISKDQFNDIAKKFGIPKQGDILISAVGTIGISWIVPDNQKFYFKDGNLLWIKNFKGVNSAYLKFFFDYSFSSVSKLAAVGAYKALTIINLKRFKIPIPSISEQQKIVEKLEGVQNYKKLLIKQKALLKELFDSVLDRSMKGELDN